MAHGLYIKSKQGAGLGSILLWFISAVMLCALMWYGYRFYTTGEQPPVPIPASALQQEVDERPVEEAERSAHSVPAMHPKSITIARLGITDARVFPMGIKENGELDTPINIFDTGWYEESATPGSGTGAILMDGHNGGPTTDGVFKRLAELRSGDEIVLERGDGEIFTYVVKENTAMSLKEADNGGMEMMTQSADISKEGLNIISCTGTWIPRDQTYSDRQMLRAVLQ